MSASKPLALVIEDDAASAEALALILNDWGAEVVRVADAAAAPSVNEHLAALRWIITDFHLGAGPDGVTLVKKLVESAPQARILVLSGSFHGKATAAATEAGFDIMQKPARANAIVAWLERA